MARKGIQDPDAELDATAIVQNMLHGTREDPTAAQPAWAPPERGERRTRRSSGRRYSADSIPGLADYFTASCPPLSWSGGLEIGNRQALMRLFSELRNDAGLAPADCRALVDLYITRLAGKSPSKPYVWDFKWRRYELLKALRASGVTVTAAEYESWQNQADTDTTTPDDAFTSSWENVS